MRILKNKTAFTLVELAIALVVLSVLIAGVLSITTTNVRNEKIATTRKRMEVVYKSIVAYVMANYSLPCPASLVKVDGDLGYGESIGDSGSCTEGGLDEGIYAATDQDEVVYGAVPFITLGLTEEYAQDAFGNKLVYVILQNFTLAEYPTATDNAGFSFASEDNSNLINIINRTSAGITENVMLVLMSLGPNRAGAFGIDSDTQNSITSANAYEQENYVKNISTVTDPDTADYGEDVAYPSKVTLNFADQSDPTFDDILFFKTRRNMFEEFPEAMFLAGCNSDDTDWEAGYSAAFYDSIDYNSSACPMPNDSNYEGKTCGIFGEKWYDRISCP